MCVCVCVFYTPLYSHTQDTNLRLLTANNSCMTFDGIELVNKAMEGRTCSLKEVDFKKSQALFTKWCKDEVCVLGGLCL